MVAVGRWTGREAALLRVALRLSVRDFAARLGVDVRTVTRWQARGTGVVLRPHMQAILDTSLGRAGLEARTRFEVLLQAAPVNVTAAATGRDSSTVLDMSQPQIEARRRDWSSYAPDVAVSVRPSTQRIAVQVNDLGVLRSLRAVDSQIGGCYLYATVAGYLQRTVAPRLFGSVGDADQGARVFSAAAALTEMAGWMAHDAGRTQLAAQHFQRALALARAGDDDQVVAQVFSSLSHLTCHQRRPEQAIAYARQGYAQLRAGGDSPAVEARLLAMRARGHAALGDGQQCSEQLRQAERALSRPAREAPSPWVSAFDEASLAAEAARCFQQLGQLVAARRQAERVVELRPRERARSRAFAQLMLTSILVAQGRPDEGCAVAGEVLDTTRALGSYLVVRQLQQLDDLMAAHSRSPDLRIFRERLRDELRARRWLAQWLPPGEADSPATVTT